MYRSTNPTRTCVHKLNHKRIVYIWGSLMMKGKTNQLNMYDINWGAFGHVSRAPQFLNVK